ncbi:MAG: hypothetical protein PVJ55_12490, partial [Anaerolineae bacterium]
MAVSRSSKAAVGAATILAGTLLVVMTLALDQAGANATSHASSLPSQNAKPLSQVPNPPWSKRIDNALWSPDFVVSVETSDTIKVVDAITTLPSEPVDLLERWNTDHLDLLDFEVSPAGSVILTDSGALTWQLPEGGRIFTLTKWYHVEPSTWTETTLFEQLWWHQELLEERPVVISKEPPRLW